MHFISFFFIVTSVGFDNFFKVISQYFKGIIDLRKSIILQASEEEEEEVTVDPHDVMQGDDPLAGRRSNIGGQGHRGMDRRGHRGAGGHGLMPMHRQRSPGSRSGSRDGLLSPEQQVCRCIAIGPSKSSSSWIHSQYYFW